MLFDLKVLDNFKGLVNDPIEEAKISTKLSITISPFKLFLSITSLT